MFDVRFHGWKDNISKLVMMWREQTQHCLHFIEAQMHCAALRLQAAIRAWSVRARVYVVHTTLDSLDPERNEMLRALEMGIGKRRAKDVISAWMLGAVARVKVDNIKAIIVDRSRREAAAGPSPELRGWSRPRRGSGSRARAASPSPSPVRYLSDPLEQGAPSNAPPLVYVGNLEGSQSPSPRKGVHVVHCSPPVHVPHQSRPQVRWPEGGGYSKLLGR